MSKEEDIIIRGDKSARIIEAISSRYGKSLDEATDIYYNSSYCNLIEEGVADLHCRNERYLASIVVEDF